MRVFGLPNQLLCLATATVVSVGLPLCAQAQEVTNSNSDVAITRTETSDTFLRFQCLNMNFRSNKDLNQVKSVLGKDSVIQLPDDVQIRKNSDGSINLNDTIETWIHTHKFTEKFKNQSHLQPRYRPCEPQETSCRGTHDEEIFLPVKVVKTSDDNLDINTDDAYGYVALDWIRRNASPKCYQTLNTTLEEAIKVDDSTISPTVAGGDSSGTGETTNSRPDNSPITYSNTHVNGRKIYNCDNTWYRTLRQNYQGNSCIRNLSLTQKAELVMKDVATINKLRPHFQLDPRYSVCTAYRETHISPNAKGGHLERGMFQITPGTARYALNDNNPVVPGFAQYRYRRDMYFNQMLKSTLAQADLHHSVLELKANLAIKAGLRASPENSQIYWQLARRYNGAGKAARHYATRITNCYNAMKQIADRSGNVRDPSRLKWALGKALN